MINCMYLIDKQIILNNIVLVNSLILILITPRYTIYNSANIHIESQKRFKITNKIR